MGEVVVSARPFDERIQPSRVRDVELHSAGSIRAMLLDKGVESVLTPANSDDVGTLLNQLVRHGKSNSGGGSDEQDVLVLERHCRLERTVSLWEMV